MGTNCFTVKDKSSEKALHSPPKKDTQEPPKKFSFGSGENGSSETKLICKVNTDRQINKYKIIKTCGVGFYSEVYQCINQKCNSNILYSIKTIKDTMLNDPKAQKHIQTEINILTELSSSKYIVKMLSYFDISNRTYVVYPYYNLDVFSLLKLTNRNLPENIIKIILSQLYCAFSYIHDKKIIYRDLKPENVLLDIVDGTIKLIDFGLSTKNENDSDLTEICGTNEYIPPEVIDGLGYSFDFDYWTFGIFAYELAYGFPPFRGKEQKEIFYYIKHNEIEFPNCRSFSKEGIDLIKSILKKDRDERIEWVNVRYHPFFKGVSFEEGPSDTLKQFLSKYQNYTPLLVEGV